MAKMPKADAELDATGLICPLPVLRANRALKTLAPGARLRIRATDPAAKSDFPVYCGATGNVLEWSGEQAGEFVFVVRKAAKPGVPGAR